MSKLSKHIQAKISDKRYIEPKPFDIDWTASEFDTGELPYTYEHRLGVKVEAKFYSDHYNKKLEHEEIVQRLKAAIIEEVFGEFRPILYKISMASYERDFLSVNKLVKELENQMFDIN